MKRLTIRAHLWFLIAAVLLPVIGTAAAFALRAAEAEARVLEEQRAELATRLAGAIDREIVEVLGRLRALAASGPLEAGDLSAFRARAALVMGEDPKIAVVLENMVGQQLLNTLVPTGQPTPRRTDLDRIADVLRGESVVTGVTPGAVNGNPIILVSVPARLKGERVALSYGFEASVVSRLVRSADFDPSWVVMIVDRDGRLIARSQDGGPPVGALASPHVVGAATAGTTEGRLFGIAPEGVAVASFFRRSQVTGWIAAIAIPQHMLTAPYYRSLIQLALLGIAGLSLALLVGSWLAVRIGRPVQALAEGAVALGTDKPLPSVPDTVAELSGMGALMTAARENIEERRQREQSLAYLAAIIAGSDDAIISKTLEGVVTSWNPGAERIFGYGAKEMIGRNITRIIPPDLQHEEQHILEKIRRGERIEHFETVRLAKDGQRIDVSLTVSPVADRDGRIIGASKISRDITMRKLAEAHQRLLSAEVNHRANNLLAVVQSIATLSAPTGDPRAFADALAARIRALAATQRQIVESDWRGVDLAAVARAQLTDIVNDPERRTQLKGPPVKLTPFAAQMLGMALHELTVNAVQHGTLRKPDGTIELTWEIIGQAETAELRLEWNERGGTSAVQTSRQGFGNRMAVALGQALSGRVQTHYRSEGLSWVLFAPVGSKDATHFLPAVTPGSLADKGGSEA